MDIVDVPMANVAVAQGSVADRAVVVAAVARGVAEGVAVDGRSDVSGNGNRM